MFSVYLISNLTNGKYYVGKTCQTVNKRWQHHVSLARRGKKIYFLNAIRKYGQDAFEMQTVATTCTEEEANQLERLWIIALRSYDPSVGYNSTYGGEGFSRGDKNPNYGKGRRGKDNPSFGRRVPDEVRARISKTLTGKLAGDKNPFFGRTHTEETRERISTAQRGQKRAPHSEETKDKIRQRMLGREFTPEWLEKMRQAKLGKKLSPEHRAKLSEAQKSRRLREAPLPI